VHNHLRTHGSEGATEPGRIGPGPVGPGRPAQPSSGVHKHEQLANRVLVKKEWEVEDVCRLHQFE
jgi:hypothetical protein